MRPKEEKIRQAKQMLEAHMSGKKNLNPTHALEVHYIAKGYKTEYSPKEPNESNRSFFHVQNMPCTLKLGNQTYEGFLTHQDYSPFYDFMSGENKFFIGSGEDINGTMRYENYEPVHLTVTATFAYSNLMLFYANASLTSSGL